MLQLSREEMHQHDRPEVDILEINRLRHSLIIGSHVWDRRLYLLDSLLCRNPSPKSPENAEALLRLKDPEMYLKDYSLHLPHEDNGTEYPKLEEFPSKFDLESEPDVQENPASLQKQWDEVCQYEENAVNSTSLERFPSAASILSDQIDSAWSGADLAPIKAQWLDNANTDVSEAVFFRPVSQKDNPTFRRLISSPARVYSFDSAQRLQERMRKVLPPSIRLSTLRSFHASGDYKYMVRDPVSNVQRTYSQVSSREAEKLNLTSSLSVSPSSLSSISLLPEGARVMAPQNGENDIIVTVYDNEPTSIISYALNSKEYLDWIAGKPSEYERGGLSNLSHIKRVSSIASDLATWQSFGSLDLDYGNYGSEDPKGSPHLRISFEDDSLSASGRVKFSVTCYFGKQFDALRRRCCPNDLDFLCSMSRCRRWSAQGGKSNVYFAKSLDERFIIKQVTKTELESFDEFAPGYFEYLTDALSSGSPTCLAKVLGIYQVHNLVFLLLPDFNVVIKLTQFKL